MNGHLALRRIAVILGAFCLTLGIWYQWVRPTYLTIAVGPSTNSVIAYVDNIARVLKETRQPYRIKVIHVPGASDAAEALNKGTVDLAVLRSDDETSRDARSIVILHKRSVILVVRKDSGIETLRDIADKRIALVNLDSDSYRPILERILSHYTIEPDDVALVEMTSPQVVAEMVEGKLDGFILIANPASKPSRSVLAELMGTHKLDLVVKGVPAHEALALRFREVVKFEIPEGVFGGSPLQPTEDADSVALTLELVATSRLSEQAATALTKSLMELRSRLRNSQDSSYTIEAPPVEEERRFLPHAGTEAFVNSEAKTLFEQYSDYVWLALFGVGIVGSSIAGLLSWAGLRREVPGDTLAERMRHLAARLEAATTVAEVDAVQGDFDDLVLSMMREYGLRRLVEGGAPDPSSWLHTFAGLITRRRALLAELAPPSAVIRPLDARSGSSMTSRAARRVRPSPQF